MRLYMAGKTCCMEDVLPGITHARKENPPALCQSLQSVLLSVPASYPPTSKGANPERHKIKASHTRTQSPRLSKKPFYNCGHAGKC